MWSKQPRCKWLVLELAVMSRFEDGFSLSSSTHNKMVVQNGHFVSGKVSTLSSSLSIRISLRRGDLTPHKRAQDYLSALFNPHSIPHHPQTQHGDDNGTSSQQHLLQHFQEHPSETAFAAFSPPGYRCLSYVAGCSWLLKDGEQISTEEVPLYTVQS